MMRKFVAVAMIALLTTVSSYQESIAGLLDVDGVVHLGNFSRGQDGKLSQSPSKTSTLNAWYLADNFFGNFFNIGTSAGANAGTQYVSHGSGISGPSAQIRAFDLFFAANASQVVFNLSFYNGHDASAAQASAVNSLNLGFTGLNATGTFLYSATVNLDPSEYFLLSQNFEYGMQLVSITGGTGAFGPALQANQGLGVFAGGPAVVGTHYNFLELWNNLRQDAGTKIANSWFGPTGPTAAARLGLYVVPEPGTFSLAGLATMGVVFRRRRR
jgi:hypothetical protein